MLRFLFPRLTNSAERGAPLFQALVARARAPHWYVEGQVPDTVDGRFAVLATIVALATVRLERGREQANAASVALTERFVGAMDAEHREIGVSDPALGRKVRKLVSGLARRVADWRISIAEGGDWEPAAARSIFGPDAPVDHEGVGHCAGALRELWARLDSTPDTRLTEGEIA